MIQLLCAGAAQSAVTALAARHELQLQAEFGAVGAMRQRLLDGAPCDVIVLTRALIDGLGARIVASADLGRVPTSVAVKSTDPAPDISNAAALQKAFRNADAVYFPDPANATAGAHCAKVLDALGVERERRIFPNGATTMREMARAAGKLIGCTQATEILATPGLRLVGPLPGEFALRTLYSAGVCRDSREAREFLALLTGQASRDLRIKAGFET